MLVRIGSYSLSNIRCQLPSKVGLLDLLIAIVQVTNLIGNCDSKSILFKAMLSLEVELGREMLGVQL